MKRSRSLPLILGMVAAVLGWTAVGTSDATAPPRKGDPGSSLGKSPGDGPADTRTRARHQNYLIVESIHRASRAVLVGSTKSEEDEYPGLDGVLESRYNITLIV